MLFQRSLVPFETLRSWVRGVELAQAVCNHKFSLRSGRMIGKRPGNLSESLGGRLVLLFLNQNRRGSKHKVHALLRITLLVGKLRGTVKRLDHAPKIPAAKLAIRHAHEYAE